MNCEFTINKGKFTYMVKTEGSVFSITPSTSESANVISIRPNRPTTADIIAKTLHSRATSRLLRSCEGYATELLIEFFIKDGYEISMLGEEYAYYPPLSVG